MEPVTVVLLTVVLSLQLYRSPFIANSQLLTFSAMGIALITHA